MPFPRVATTPCAVQALANNFGAFSKIVPPFLNTVNLAHSIVGPRPLQYISSALNRLSGNMVPEWNPYMPKVDLMAHSCSVASSLLGRDI